MDFSFSGGDWVVDALKIFEASIHLMIIGYGLVSAVVLRALAALIAAIRWW